MTEDNFIAPLCSEQIQVLFEDPYLLVIDKPSGLLSLSGKNPLNRDSVHYRLVQDYPSAMMVHRLDFGTSGVMILALRKEISAHLGKQFQARSIVKKYIATLFGHLHDDEGLIDAPIARAEFPYQKVCAKTGKEAQSHYRVLQRLINTDTGLKTTQVEFTPLTGRTHQLRIHSLEIGHPIIGCDLYGLRVEDNKGGNPNCEDPLYIETSLLAKRLALHAVSVEFYHPVRKTRMCVESPTQF